MAKGNIQLLSHEAIGKTDVDLDTLTDAGIYYVICNQGASEAASTYHFPGTSVSGLVAVIRSASGSYIRQIFYRCGTVDTNDYQYWTRQIRINTSPITIGTWEKILSQHDLDTLKSSFQDGVSTLYDECVDCGVTPSAKTPAAIAAAIQKIAAKVHIVSLGSGTSINVKSKLPDVYKTLTKDNFFVEFKGVSSNGGARNTDDAQYPQFGTIDCSASMSKSYSASTGVLTISGLSASKQSDTSGWVRWVETAVSINVYCVY